MNAARILSALEIPVHDRVDQRVPKKLLQDSAAVASGDKTLLQNGVEEVTWVAVFKPGSIGAPVYKDGEREYLEIAVIHVRVRQEARTARIAELVHRSIPYPVLLLLEQVDGTLISVAHKRWAQNDTTKMVLDESSADVWLDSKTDEAVDAVNAFLESLSLRLQSRNHLKDLYQGWIDAVNALQTARFTGRFVLPASREDAQDQRGLLQRCRDIDLKLTSLRAAALKEKQVPRQVDLNLEIKRLRLERERLVSLMNRI
ncbi:MAG: DUF4391 domain-containing protein [Fibrobacteres bacterium]|nr:DUF4391 domain-containing protein [Fibrobacterota bacterium]